MKKFLFLGLVAVGASAHAVMIDNFSVGFSTGFNGGPNTRVDVTAGGVLTGQRDVEMRIQSNPLNQFFDVSIGGGLAVSSSGFGTDGQVKLQYDGIDEAGNTGFGNVLTNSSAALGLGGNDRVRIGWVGNDLDVAVTVELRQAGSLLSSSSLTRVAGSGAGLMDILVSGAHMAAADNITIVFDPVTNGDFALSKIEAVPEPATMTALALGAAALLRRRKKA